MNDANAVTSIIRCICQQQQHVAEGAAAVIARATATAFVAVVKVVTASLTATGDRSETESASSGVRSLLTRGRLTGRPKLYRCFFDL